MLSVFLVRNDKVSFIAADGQMVVSLSLSITVGGINADKSVQVLLNR